VAPAASFCDECGERLEFACPGCGEGNRPVAKFCKHCGARLRGASAPPAGRFAEPTAYTPPHLAERILRSRAALAGERKQVTVLFADVEDFTGLGASLDPESLHELMDRVFATLLEVIHRHEGTVNQFTGDGVMALFGAPVALEDHALAAVRAALQIQQRMTSSADEFRARWERAPGLRIGLNTGLVVVGAIGDDLRMDYTAQGDAVNLAARLQALAAVGTVAMSEATWRAVADRVECAGLGQHHVKGRAEPIEVFRPERLLSERRPGTGPVLSPFVNRESELGQLLGLYEAACAGRPQVVVVAGDAGVGKSRWLYECRERLAGSRPCWFEGRCVPYGRDTPYRPLVDIVRATLALHESDPEALAMQKLERGLAELRDGAAQLGPPLRYLLALGAPDTAMALLAPSDRKAAITLALDRLIRARARRTPHVLVIEDCQWLDAASEEYLARFPTEFAGAAVLLVLSRRQDTRDRARAGPAGARIDLRPLVPSEAQKLIRLVAGPTSLPEPLVGLVLDRAGGNPLFIEEVVRASLEHRDTEIPSTVAGVLGARIDHLPGAAKSVLQVASVAGREFPRRLLERVVEDADSLDGALGLLTDLGLIAERPDAPGSYAFRLGLLEETAYEGLLLQRRKALHRRLGEAIEDLDPDRLFEHADTLALHFSRAEEWARAAFYLREAGRKAAALCANDEAVERLTLALEALGRTPETLERSGLAIDIRLDLRAPLLQLGRLEDVLRVSREAEELARLVGDERRLARVYAYLINYHYLTGEPGLAIDHGRRCLEIAARVSVPGLERSARQYLGTSYHALGRSAMAEEMLRRNIGDLGAREERLRAGPENLLYVTSCGWLAWALAETGDFEDAHTSAGTALGAAEAAGNAYALAIAESLAALVWLRQGHVDRAAPLLERALARCDEHHLGVWRPIPSSLLGLACALDGQLERGLTLLRGAVAETKQLGVNAYRALWTAHLAEGLLVAGQTQPALDVAREAVGLATEFKEAGNHARALLALGEAYRRTGDSSLARADETLRQALLEAEELKLAPLVAHCYAALGRLAAATGDQERAAEYTTTAREQATRLHLRLWPQAVGVDVRQG
jgi:class 3 adenylate cyclase/tetratricopeptide (TPR) repeat protein